MGVFALKLTNQHKVHLGRSVKESSGSAACACSHLPISSGAGKVAFPPFHSAWGFGFSSFEPPSFHGLSMLGWLSAGFLASGWAIFSQLHWPGDILNRDW